MSLTSWFVIKFRLNSFSPSFRRTALGSSSQGRVSLSNDSKSACGRCITVHCCRSPSVLIILLLLVICLWQCLKAWVFLALFGDLQLLSQNNFWKLFPTLLLYNSNCLCWQGVGLGFPLSSWLLISTSLSLSLSLSLLHQLMVKCCSFSYWCPCFPLLSSSAVVVHSSSRNSCFS